MQLVSTLAAGVKGAESGTATLYQRGTSTPATYYSDGYGATAVSTGAALQLDANGGATVYLNQSCDINVMDADGVLVRAFTEVLETTAMTYSGTAWKGTNPVTAASAINQPKILKEILDSLGTSFGTTGGQVTFRGSDRNLYQVLAGLDCFFNVMDPLYGATGDGSTDDTSAIQAAMDAAATAGGGVVFFPAAPNYYKISAVLNKAAGVNMLGVGATSCVIAQSANAKMLDCASDSEITFVQGIFFNATVAVTANVIELGNSNILFDKCQIGDGVNVQGALVSLSSSGDGTNPSQFIFRDCMFLVGADNKAAIKTDTSGLVTVVDNCQFTPPATYNYLLLQAYTAFISGCSFLNTPCTVGTMYDIYITTGVIEGCSFTNTGGATGSAINPRTGITHEYGNIFGTTITAYVALTAETQCKALQAKSRESRYKEYTVASTPTTLDSLNYGNIKVYSTVAGSVTLKLTPAPRGATLRLTVVNSDGSNRAFTIETIGTDTNLYVIDSTIPVTINASTHKGYTLVSEQVAAATDITFWAAVGIA